MKNKSALLAALALGVAMLPQNEWAEVIYDDDKLPPNPKPKQEPIYVPPSGTKEYFFNSIGEFSTVKMLKSECVFKCFAINDKNAKRKFNKWATVNEGNN